MTTTYDPGDGVTVSFACRDDAGALGDPTDVYLDVHHHGELSPTTYHYGQGDTIVRDAEGQYHALLEPDQPGLWHYGWRGTGEIVVAEQGSFLVRRWMPGEGSETS